MILKWESRRSWDNGQSEFRNKNKYMNMKFVKSWNDYKDVNTEMYGTSDLGLVSALVVLGYKIESNNELDENDKYKRRKIIKFKNTDQLRQDVELYWKDELDVPALTYFQTIKNIRTRIQNFG